MRTLKVDRLQFWAGLGVAALLLLTLFPASRTNLVRLFVYRETLLGHGRADGVAPAGWLDALLGPQPSPENAMWLAERSVIHGNWSDAAEAYQQVKLAPEVTERALARLERFVVLWDFCPAQANEIVPLFQSLTAAGLGYQHWASACAAAGHLDVAVEAQRRALELAPEPAQARELLWLYWQRAEADRTGGRLTEAGVNYDQVLTLYTEYPPIVGDVRSHYAAGWSYWQRQQPEASIQAYQACLAAVSGPDATAYTCAFHLGSIYSAWLPAAQQDRSLAAAYFEQAQQLAPDDALRQQLEQR